MPSSRDDSKFPWSRGGSDSPEALPFAVDAARKRDADPWGSHLILDDDGALVGFGGFKGEPSKKRVEIGYAVAPTRRGRGIATAAVGWMINRASEANVEVVIAHTLPEINASTAVLARCGFLHVATTDDPDGGVAAGVYRWELFLADADADANANA
jgi:ribosomal-protein-alanine N-acetyltransferase